MPNLMRCPYCGLLQDEPKGAKSCLRCGGSLEYENQLPTGQVSSYLKAQMELDQVAAPAGRNVERYLLVTIKTPDKVPANEAAPAGKARPPIGFNAVLDVSGSMHGEKLPFAKEAVRQAVRLLHSGDSFSLATFSTEAKCPFPPEEVNENTLARSPRRSPPNHRARRQHRPGCRVGTGYCECRQKETRYQPGDAAQ